MFHIPVYTSPVPMLLQLFYYVINVSIKINNVSEETIREAVFHGFVVSAVTACESLNHSYGNILDFPKEHHLNYR